MHIYAVPFSDHILVKVAEFFIKNDIDFKKTILIFPTQRSKLYFGHYLANLSKKSALLLPNMYEVSEFYQEITLSDYNGVLINELHRNLLLKEATLKVKEDLTPLFRKERFLGSFLEFASIGKKLLRFYDEVILEDIDFDVLKREGLYTDIEVHIHILEAILREYKRLLKERELIDPVIKQAKAHLDGDFLMQFNTLCFIGAISMTKSETMILQKIDHLIPVNIFFHTDKPLIEQHKVILKRCGLKEEDIVWLSLPARHRYLPARACPPRPLNQVQGRRASQWQAGVQALAGGKGFKPRFLEIKAFPNAISQVSLIIKAISDSITQGTSPGEIAIILPDESLKDAILDFIHEKNLNLTMGLDIRHSLIYGLLYDFYKILASERESSFYYKDFLTFLKNPIVKNLCLEGRFIREDIDCTISFLLKENLIYIPCQLLNKLIPLLLKFILKERAHLEKVNNLYDFCGYIEQLLKSLPGYLRDSGLLDHHHQRCALNNMLKRIKELSNLESIGVNIATDLPAQASQWQAGGLSYLRFLLDQLSDETYPIPSDIIEAIQVMGVLETRNLSFKTVIIPDMNEGIFPWKSEKDLFLNTQIRIAVGLPTFTDREALCAYYFRRLIDSAHRVYLSYVEQKDRGVRSRFIEELVFKEVKRPGVDIEDVEKNIAQGKAYVLSLFSKEKKVSPITYSSPAKDSADLDRLYKLRFNPSMLTTYISCPYHFYLQYVLDIKPPRQIEEEITPLDIGQIVHSTLNKVYRNHKVWKMSAPELHNIIWKTIQGHFDCLQPGQRITLDVLREKLRFFTENECNEFSSGWFPKVEFLEYKMEAYINLERKKVCLNGILDRLDKKNDQFRLLDYKTGKQVTKKECSIGENFKAPQLPFYLYLLKLKDKFYYKNCKALGIYDLKTTFEIKRPYQDFQKDPVSYMQSFEKWLYDMLREIFSKDRPWHKKVSMDCEYCPYQDMCNQIEG